MTIGLLAPINPEFFMGLPGIKDYFSRYFNYDIVVKPARIIFVIISFFIIWDILSYLRKRKGNIDETNIS